MQIKAYFALGTKVFAKARVTVFYSASYNFKEKKRVKKKLCILQINYINALVTLAKALMILKVQSFYFHMLEHSNSLPDSSNSMPH